MPDADLQPAAQVRLWPLERGVTKGVAYDAPEASVSLWVMELETKHDACTIGAGHTFHQVRSDESLTRRIRG